MSTTSVWDGGRLGARSSPESWCSAQLPRGWWAWATLQVAIILGDGLVSWPGLLLAGEKPVIYLAVMAVLLVALLVGIVGVEVSFRWDAGVAGVATPSADQPGRGDKLVDVNRRGAATGSTGPASWLWPQWGDPEPPVPPVSVSALPVGSALLVVKRGPDDGLRFLLDQDTTSAGRHPESGIFLDDRTVSLRHAEFRREGGEFVVVDVGSLNGTWVNREPVDTRVLANGDEVQIGKFRLVFYEGPCTGPRGDVSGWQHA